jgi:hypothetical protein
MSIGAAATDVVGEIDIRYYTEKETYNRKQALEEAPYRVRAYKDIDMRFMSYIYGNYYRTDSGDDLRNIRLVKTTSGYRFSWDELEGAYGYEVKYEIVDENSDTAPVYVRGTWYVKGDSGYELTDKKLITGRSFFEIPADSAWKGKYIRIYVRAVYGNYMKYMDNMEGGNENDTSDWSSITEPSDIPEE